MSDTIYYPLTSPQKSIWYTERMYSGTSISNVAGTLRIKDKVDVGILDKAINLFIKNNDGMRLRVCLDDDGNPQQYIYEYIYKNIEIKDFSGFEDPMKAMQKWDSQETLRPFELLNSELYRFTIIKLNDLDVGFYIITHHIISDAWNMSLLGSSIVDYYCKIFNNQNDLSIDNIMPSYISYIKNEQLYMESNRYEKDKTYWEQTFRTVPESTFLKVSKSNSISTKSKRKTFIIPKKFANKLRDYCEENKTTPYPLFLSALAMYINRVTEKEDIVLGTPILNRLNHSDKNTSGMFISTIPLRINVKSKVSFFELSQGILDLCSISYRHQRYPYEHILKYVREKHDFKENLYDIVLSYQNSKFDKSFDVEYITRWHFNENQSNSLTIHINDREGEGALIIDYDYHSDLYYDKEIEFIHQHILSLLWHALDNPNNLICKIEMLTESEKKKVLYDFNDTYAEYPREKTIHQLFEEQVERTPENIALVFEDRQVTYKELNQKANSLANVLRNKGVKPDDIVGIMVNRSVEMIVGIIAILKAGGAYLPIEPGYPQERIKFLLNNSGAKYLLSTTKLYSIDFGIRLINLHDSDNYNQELYENLPYTNVSSDIVYVIYTSGSSGSPKGVIVEHKSLHNFIIGVKKLLVFDSLSVVLSVTTICFDIFAFELFTSLLSGSTIIIANENEQNNPRLLSDLIINNNVSTILTTPSRMKFFINEDKFKKSLLKVNQIMLGGEELELNFFNRLKQLTNAAIINGYGPTETTIGVTFKDVTNSNKITIGKPISNTRCYIVDKYFNLAPIGAQGELCISGEGLARGYLNNKELTENAFVLNPFDRSERLYKTGDIARWFPKGEIKFIGRIDKQVKLRGYRIELEEIENVIQQYNGIKDVVVILKRNSDFGDSLCAYCVSDSTILIKELKSLLASQLPRYMVPKFIIQVESIPITSNGKKDTSKLPDVDYQNCISDSIIMPSTKMEKKLLDVFHKLMKGSEISVDDNIFEYGADSLTVIQLISQLENDGYNLRIDDVYKNPTIVELGQWISTNCRKTYYKTMKSNKKKNIEMNSIIELMEKGDLPKLDSAALSYIPDDLMINPIDDDPLLYNYINTSLGNIGVICLPIKGKKLYSQKERLLELSMKAISQAEFLGATVISLTGLIPSATNYGIDIINKLSSDIIITTGHATTAAAVILSLERLLLESNRDINTEQIIVLGIGSVGASVTELLLSIYPEIKKITLCDLQEKNNELNMLKQKLQKNYKGKIELLYTSIGGLPKDVYDSTLIIGATNVPNIIDISLLRPGTLIIDDSGPHCFSKIDAVKRLSEANDILFTEGGVLSSEDKINKFIYLPNYFDKKIINQYSQYFTNNNSITGCILSSLLTAKNDDLSPTIGRAGCNESMRHYYALKKNGYLGAILHCDDFVIPENMIKAFRILYGMNEKKGEKYAI